VLGQAGGERLPRLVGLLASATGGRDAPDPLAPALHNLLPDLVDRGHAVATVRLFRCAAEAGAVVAGVADTAGWAQLGEHLGLCYQATRGEQLLAAARERLPALAADPHRVLRLLGDIEPHLAPYLGS
jgi:hypothetical protein